METTRRIKKLNGIEYWFEETPYYDKEKKQIRHRSKYLGRNINGQPVRMREASHEVKKQVKGVMEAKQAYNYGNLLPALQVIDECHMDQYLNSLLSSEEVSVVLALSINRVVRPVAMHSIRTWYDGTTLYLDNPHLPLASQRISELLQKIGESDIPARFMGLFLESLGPKSTLLYDITSLSSYSSLINLLEYGYNRDGVHLPQLNLGLILDTKTHTPVMYDIFPGSIVDVSTLSLTLDKLEAYGVSDFTAVMDRGFFSRKNLEDLLGRKIAFIMPATLLLKEVKELMTDAQKDIDTMQYLQMFEKETLFVKPVSLPIGTSEVQGYCYFDPKRAEHEKALIRKRLVEVKGALLKVHISNWQNAEDVVRNIARDLTRYFEWSCQENHLDVSIRQNAVSQMMNKMGKYFLFYSGPFDWDSCLSIYRERDMIEKAFKDLKNEIDALPLNTHKESTTRGFLFVAFLGLIIRMQLLKRMKEAEISENYSLEMLMLELEKVRKIKLANGTVVVSELTKKQRELLKILQLCA